MFRRLLSARPALVAIAVTALALLAAGLGAAGFSSGADEAQGAPSMSAVAATTTTILDSDPAATTTTPAPPDSTTTTEVAEYRFSTHALDEDLQRLLKDYNVWRPGSPVSFDMLRLLKVSHWDFEGSVTTGSLVVHRAWTDELAGVFRKLFDAKFPIQRMDPINALRHTSDCESSWNNSECYEARSVNGGWSMHAHGLAVDINPVQNPWVRPGKAKVPAVGAPYADRSIDRPGMIHADGVVVKAFKEIGWKWGGDWSSSKDYMHFSYNGR